MKMGWIAVIMHHGGYSNLSEAYGAVVSWIAANGYEITGAPFDLYVRTQFDSLSPEDWETEVYFPVRIKCFFLTVIRPSRRIFPSSLDKALRSRFR